MPGLDEQHERRSRRSRTPSTRWRPTRRPAARRACASRWWPSSDVAIGRPMRIRLASGHHTDRAHLRAPCRRRGDRMQRCSAGVTTLHSAAVHVVVVGCGRVGSSLGPRLIDERAHRRGHRPAGRGVRPPRADFTGRRSQGIGFDRDRLIEAGIEEAGALAAVTSGDNSNILVARVARENFGDRARRRPHLRPAAGRHLPAPRASRRWPPWRGPPTRCCAG